MELKTTLILEERDARNALQNIYTIGDTIRVLTSSGTKYGRVSNITCDTVELDISTFLNSKFITLNTKDIYTIAKTN